jgi:hypothetical protein
MQIEEDDNYVYVYQKDYIMNIDLLRIKDVVKVEKVSNEVMCELESV